MASTVQILAENLNVGYAGYNERESSKEKAALYHHQRKFWWCATLRL
jgi:hypothetical protein